MVETKTDATNERPSQEPDLQPWITPRFERVELRRALSGPITDPPRADATTGSS